jgi:hypothetical protein
MLGLLGLAALLGPGCGRSGFEQWLAEPAAGDPQPFCAADCSSELDADAGAGADSDATADPGGTPCSPGNLTVSIAENADDGELELGYLGELFVDGEPGYTNTIFAGYNQVPIGGPVWVFLRFTLANALPATATITSANLRAWGTILFAWTPSVDAARVRIELSGDAPQVASRDDAPELATIGRPLSAGAVRWPASGGLAWQWPAWNTSPDLAPLFQELVTTQGGVAAGAHVQLWLDADPSVDGEVGIEDFSHADAHHSELTLYWTCP